MKVFALKTDPTRYCQFALRDRADAHIYDRFDGSSLARSWRPVAMTAADEPDADAELADYSLLGVVPVFSVPAVDALLDLLSPAGELLPLRYGRCEYLAYNVTRVIDALDESASTVKRFRDGGIMKILRYVFLAHRIGDAAVFKIPQLPKAFVFVTSVFVERVRTHELTGFDFPLLWAGDCDSSVV